MLRCVCVFIEHTLADHCWPVRIKGRYAGQEIQGESFVCGDVRVDEVLSFLVAMVSVVLGKSNISHLTHSFIKASINQPSAHRLLLLELPAILEVEKGGRSNGG